MIIVHDGEKQAVERCCFCWKRTNYWRAKEDVAVCPTCAKKHKASEVPTKREWIKECLTKYPYLWMQRGATQDSPEKPCPSTRISLREAPMKFIPTDVWKELPKPIKDAVDEQIKDWLKAQEAKKKVGK